MKKLIPIFIGLAILEAIAWLPKSQYSDVWIALGLVSWAAFGLHWEYSLDQDKQRLRITVGFLQSLPIRTYVVPVSRIERIEDFSIGHLKRPWTVRLLGRIRPGKMQTIKVKSGFGLLRQSLLVVSADDPKNLEREIEAAREVVAREQPPT